MKKIEGKIGVCTFKFVLAAGFFIILAVTLPGYAGAPDGRQPPSTPLDLGHVPGELLVRFAPKADGMQLSKTEKNQILSSLGAANVIKGYRLVPGLSHVKLPAGVTVEQAIAQLNKTQGVMYAQPNHYLMLCSGQKFPNDERFYALWGMHNTGQMMCLGPAGTVDADIDAPEAWYLETDASEIIVAVIDSGVDYWHEDLVANMWINPEEDQEPFGELTEDDWNGEDEDENGLEDDICGWDFVNGDDDPMDDDEDGGHGTHIAGTIGAEGDNDDGVVGVCWKVKIMALRLFLNNNDFGTESDAIDCIVYADDKGANVISCSWGRYPPGYPGALEETIEAAGDNGVLFVAAVNNHDENVDQEPFYPACWELDNIISVMATDNFDKRPSWSNYGATSVDLAAPGTCILSCVPFALYDPFEYYPFHGTSMSTPHVSGACALVWSANPYLTHLQVRQVVLDTVDELEDLEDRCVTEGRLNVYKAMDSLYNFCVKNSSGDPVAWFDSFGNLFLEGSLTQRDSQTRPIATGDDEFIFKNSSGNLMIINTTNGNMDIYGEYMVDEWPGPGPSEQEDEFIIKGPNGVVAYINESGNLYLDGELYPDLNP